MLLIVSPNQRCEIKISKFSDTFIYDIHFKMCLRYFWFDLRFLYFTARSILFQNVYVSLQISCNFWICDIWLGMKESCNWFIVFKATYFQCDYSTHCETHKLFLADKFSPFSIRSKVWANFRHHLQIIVVFP